MASKKKITKKRFYMNASTVGKALKLIGACPDKSDEFVNAVKKLGFKKAYIKYVDKYWGEGYNYTGWSEFDIRNPVGDLVYYTEKTRNGYQTDTKKNYLKKYSPEIIRALVKKLLSKKS
jgi:hypothetical protein